MERACRDVPVIDIATVPREQVEADGSILIRALTAQVATLSAMLKEERHECEASNAYRESLVEAKRLALEELERLRSE